MIKILKKRQCLVHLLMLNGSSVPRFAAFGIIPVFVTCEYPACGGKKKLFFFLDGCPFLSSSLVIEEKIQNLNNHYEKAWRI
jgi:hypothetical protein